ncbi:ROK family protein [Halobacillus kuroshimensis]|uniref:ROK family protein n=1 Tax=Halobacillus kuroshimensis TaxID=302481 RepID=UPI000416B4B1|nr:ROK family protein [Halobacillus kuroshimensis]
MHVIGIDIGGTTVKGVLLDEQMELVHKSTSPTDAKAGRDAILSSLSGVIGTLTEASETPIRGIGIGSAGRINVGTGVVEYATENLPGWHGFALKSWVEEKYNLPVIVDNDANTALIGELYFNHLLIETQHTIMLTLGTGVGGANYFSGQVVRGAHHQGGEWGHMVLYPGGRPCNCGKSGCLEQYISGSALRKEAEKETGRTFLQGRDVFKAAQQDARVNKVVTQFISDLALVIENISISLDPDRIILGGGVTESRDYWWEDMQDLLNQKGVETEVTPSLYRNRSGMYGAALLASQMRKEVKSHEST